MSDIDTIEKEALAAIDGAGDLASLDAVRVAELGKKGRVSGLMKNTWADGRRSAQGNGPEAERAQNPRR